MKRHLGLGCWQRTDGEYQKYFAEPHPHHFFVTVNLIDAKCDGLMNVQNLFDEMPQRNLC
ncbi:hypothetical protein NC652_006929 [Populus alba x Populus x berolinensis]|nr:hypothetical protein NC652_006929 [Populus alba x Populus x berolinensis]